MFLFGVLSIMAESVIQCRFEGCKWKVKGALHRVFWFRQTTKLVERLEAPKMEASIGLGRLQLAIVSQSFM